MKTQTVLSMLFFTPGPLTQPSSIKAEMKNEGFAVCLDVVHFDN